MDNKKLIICELVKAHNRGGGKSVSELTKEAQTITKRWQEAVKAKLKERVDVERRVSDYNSEKIDVVDLEEGVAYELKVSGNNTHHEFYKDLIKVLTHNLNYKPIIKTLVFVSEKKGVVSLKNRLDKKLVEMFEEVHSIKIELVELGE